MIILLVFIWNLRASLWNVHLEQTQSAPFASFLPWFTLRFSFLFSRIVKLSTALAALAPQQMTVLSKLSSPPALAAPSHGRPLAPWTSCRAGRQPAPLCQSLTQTQKNVKRARKMTSPTRSLTIMPRKTRAVGKKRRLPRGGTVGQEGIMSFSWMGN